MPDSKKILIVDDDTVTRGLYSRVLKNYSDDFEILTAEDGMEATRLLKEKNIDLVITDVQMPLIDGFELIAHMTLHYPETPVFVMTAFEIPKTDTAKNALKTSRLFTKPIDMDILAQSIFKEFDSRAKGNLIGIGLPSFLQLIEIEEKTCTLQVSSGNKTGWMYFIKGELFSADYGNLRNEEAVYELVSWKNVEIKIDNVCRKKNKEIQQPLMSILIKSSS